MTPASPILSPSSAPAPINASTATCAPHLRRRINVADARLADPLSLLRSAADLRLDGRLRAATEFIAAPLPSRKGKQKNIYGV
ncbi:hypothetical protein OsJ_32648 [Oryza sativa Japonica Group]|uniref:Uncharacterized protein n=1 Tax=Oryza sativa subsp. japonica TaxID=39947 RepID=B9G8Y7_ORYSJ|nr:hypothetical protein OsJ_32648 [Oryza sativa Japonica Group]